MQIHLKENNSHAEAFFNKYSPTDNEIKTGSQADKKGVKAPLTPSELKTKDKT